MQKEGGFSLVTDPSGGRFTKLPSYYVNTSRMFAARDLAAVRSQLGRAIDAFRRSGTRATYMLTACEVGGRKGLYGSDFFNRSAYRRSLSRLGMRFSDDPFTVFNDDDTFESADFPPFHPSFLTLGVPSIDAGVLPTSGALLVYRFAFYRIADIEAAELARLSRVAAELDALSAHEPRDLAGALGAPVRAG